MPQNQSRDARPGEAPAGGQPAKSACLADQTARVLAAYAYGVDHRDEQALRTVFWPDADLGEGGVQGLIAWVTQFSRPGCAHHITTHHVQLEGPDKARAYTLFIASSPGEAGTVEFAGGRYLDLFECRGGRWAVTRRRVEIDWQVTAPRGVSPQGEGKDRKGVKK